MFGHPVSGLLCKPVYLSEPSSRKRHRFTHHTTVSADGEENGLAQDGHKSKASKAAESEPNPCHLPVSAPALPQRSSQSSASIASAPPWPPTATNSITSSSQSSVVGPQYIQPSIWHGHRLFMLKQHPLDLSRAGWLPVPGGQPFSHGRSHPDAASNSRSV